KEVRRKESGYPVGEYIVYLTKDSDESREVVIGNIIFNINCGEPNNKEEVGLVRDYLNLPANRELWDKLHDEDLSYITRRRSQLDPLSSDISQLVFHKAWMFGLQSVIWDVLTKKINRLVFSNKEIIEYLVNPLKKYPELDIHIYSVDEKKLDETSTEKIQVICFEGDDSEFALHFFGRSVALFTPFSVSEIIFVDEHLVIGYDEAYDNILYEGLLHDKSPKEILELVLQFIVLFIRAVNIEVSSKIDEAKKHTLSRVNGKDSPLEFTVKIQNDSGEKKEIIFDNIKFVIN
ncbi:MAG: hypothetical protein LBV41_13570, partial [Cytophagaceae bacterium]|nr:hypothetical protein [Cytophagaceae bacterium]